MKYFVFLLILSHALSAEFLERMHEIAECPELKGAIERFEAYQRDIPSFSRGNFCELQAELLFAAAKALKQQEVYCLDDYPVSEKRRTVHFISDAETGKPMAVFKTDGQRRCEVLTWELSGILGLEDVFTPSMPLTLYGNDGELQLYRQNDLTVQQSYNESLYDFVTFDSYIKCALGVLAFALGDMHNENCYFQLCREGYIQMGMFDTAVAFGHTEFIPYNVDPEHPSLLAPYCWIGWDFPQVGRRIEKKFKTGLASFMKSWPDRIEDLERYAAHPLTSLPIADHRFQEILDRAEQLYELIMQNPEKPVRSWHEALAPHFPEVETKLRDFAPGYKTTWLLFRLHWYPSRVYSDWISPERHEEFKQWLKDFLEKVYE